MENSSKKSTGNSTQFNSKDNIQTEIGLKWQLVLFQREPRTGAYVHLINEWINECITQSINSFLCWLPVHLKPRKTSKKAPNTLYFLIVRCFSLLFFTFLYFSYFLIFWVEVPGSLAVASLRPTPMPTPMPMPIPQATRPHCKALRLLWQTAGRHLTGPFSSFKGASRYLLLSK